MLNWFQMMRLLLSFYFIFTFVSTALAIDTCCSDTPEIHAGTTLNETTSAESDSAKDMECDNCVQCSYRIVILPAPVIKTETQLLTNNYLPYVPSFSPSPDPLGLFRPPIV